MTKGTNVCCPYFRTIRCEDTEEHRHIYCKSKKCIMANSDTIFKCISDHNWIECEYFKEVDK
jgi:hypothetical protein